MQHRNVNEGPTVIEVKWFLSRSAPISMKRLRTRGSIGHMGEFHAGPRHCCTLKAPMAIIVTCSTPAVQSPAKTGPVLGAEAQQVLRLVVYLKEILISVRSFAQVNSTNYILWGIESVYSRANTTFNMPILPKVDK